MAAPRPTTARPPTRRRPRAAPQPRQAAPPPADVPYPHDDRRRAKSRRTLAPGRAGAARAADYRASGVDAFLRSVRLLPAAEGEQRAGYPWALPAIGALHDGLELDPRVTYLIGENGSGKSTL